jgi:hypothetical protein
MSQAKSNHVSAKLAECRPRLWQGIEPVCQFAVEGLFGDVPALIEWIERVGESVVKNCQTRNLFPKEIL